MKTYVPDYYSRFACRAGACRHTCCIGWEIDVDEDTLAFYRKQKGEFGRRLRDSIEVTDGTPFFKLLPGDRCPFLNGENLCDIYIHLGEEHLCQICTDHPRYRSFLGDRCEMGLGLCCEEAAALILGQEGKTAWTLFSDDGEEDAGPDEWEEAILSAREEILTQLQKRELSLAERLAAVTERYFGIPFDPGFPFGRDWTAWAEVFRNLERLEKDTDPDSHPDEKTWDDLLDVLAEPVKQERLPDVWGEQLLVYFVNRHLPDSADEWDLRARLAFAVLSTAVIVKMCASTDGGFASLCDTARRYSSEIEYSEDNTAVLLDELDGLVN